MSSLNDNELVDYDDAVDTSIDVELKSDANKDEAKKVSYSGMHTTSFRDMMLKPELLNAISENGFENPSEVQQEAIPQALYGTDIICQAKAGMGKTAVFVLSTLQLLSSSSQSQSSSSSSTTTTSSSSSTAIDTLVLVHTRELAYQICKDYQRFSTHLPDVRVAVFLGGIPYDVHKKVYEDKKPNIIVGTPGRILQMVHDKSLSFNLSSLKRFILDECDQLLESIDMRKDVQEIFKQTPLDKQVMLFSATLSKEIRVICQKFTNNPHEIFINDEKKLVLPGLQQYSVKLAENKKNRKLIDLLDILEFKQIIIFVSSVRRCKELTKLLKEQNFPAHPFHSEMNQQERLEAYNKFKNNDTRVLVSTDIFGRGVDFEGVNVVINYDMPNKADQYLHRVGRSGRFGTKGLAISFVASDDDEKIYKEVEQRFEIQIAALPDKIDPSSYMNA